MFKKSKFAVCAAFIVFAASAAAATNNTFPIIDLQERCRTSEYAIIEMMGNTAKKGEAFDTCMKSEQAARDALKGAWTDIPPAYKSFCVRPKDYSPSYVEWLACVEMTIDLRKLRSAVVGTPDDARKLCPIIKYEKDGSIISVNACALR
jgi:hypothetical protein